MATTTRHHIVWPPQFDATLLGHNSTSPCGPYHLVGPYKPFNHHSSIVHPPYRPFNHHSSIVNPPYQPLWHHSSYSSLDLLTSMIEFYKLRLLKIIVSPHIKSIHIHNVLMAPMRILSDINYSLEGWRQTYRWSWRIISRQLSKLSFIATSIGRDIRFFLTGAPCNM